MTEQVLITLLSGREIGRLIRDRRGSLSFTYREDWRSRREAFPLSLSLPLASNEHGHRLIEAFLWGLLPDNERILERWARRYQVSARNVFRLIEQVGEDLPGAVQFVRPERVSTFFDITAAPKIEWLDDSKIAERLRELRADPSAWRRPDDEGKFSLAGAQPKTAFAYQDGRWGLPSGRAPTTHILKPPSGEFEGLVENEHMCLALARSLGLAAVPSEVRRFKDEIAIVIERYDRVRTSMLTAAASAEAAAKAAQAAAAADAAKSESRDSVINAAVTAANAAAETAAAAAKARAFAELEKTQPVLRLHQEDLCQALGLPPSSKYQNEGGPAPSTVAALLWEHSRRPLEDVGAFRDALAFNWLIGGPDAHAKNYSLLHAGGGVRLAPLYDLASGLPYFDPKKIKLAMKIGGTYRLRDVGARNFRKLAQELRLSPDETVDRVTGFATALPDRVADIRKRAVREGLSRSIVERLANLLTLRARECLHSLTAAHPADSGNA
jgi:HipA-like protein